MVTRTRGKSTIKKKDRKPSSFIFPVGNQFWQLRSKHGRDRIFKSPALLWEAACEYFQWVVDNPLIEIDFVGKDAERVEKPHTRPLTYEGLFSYLGVNKDYFNDFERSLEGKKDGLSADFSGIITHIRQTIYRQKFEGAACGFYNANIIARDLGLADKSDITSGEKPLKQNLTIIVDSPETAETLKKLRDHAG